MEPTPTVRLVVVDLDNTLWDWLNIWFQSLDQLLDDVSTETGISRDVLESEAKVAHQAVHTSDHELVLDDLPSLKALYPGKNPRKVLGEPMHAYYSTRKRLTTLYPGVQETLGRIKASGARVVAYTESDEFQATLRIKRTGLDGLLDEVWVSPDQAVTDEATRRRLRTGAPEDYELAVTARKTLQAGLHKPAPTVLLRICQEARVDPWETVFVGDSISRDVAMAKNAGVIAVHAKYGNSWPKDRLELLTRVSHWSAEDVAVDELVRATAPTVTGYVLERGLWELSSMFDFEPPRTRDSPLEAAQLNAVVELWKMSVDVQKSFNTISWQIRGLGLTAITAAFAGAGVLIKESVTLTLRGREVSAAGGILVLAGFLWASLWFMERRWYHRLLVGAGKQADHLEGELRVALGDRKIGLSRDITEASHSTPWILRKKVVLRRRGTVGMRRRWWPLGLERRLTKARNRLDVFYLWVVGIIALSVVALWWPLVTDMARRIAH
jgi:phosphoglycolate phosphatase-like HAD superfamily hydrolase